MYRFSRRNTAFLAGIAVVLVLIIGFAGWRYTAAAWESTPTAPERTRRNRAQSAATTYPHTAPASLSAEEQLSRIAELLPRVAPAGEELIEWDSSAKRWIADSAYEELANLSAVARMTDQQWRFVIENKGVIRTRARWPVGVPLKMCLTELRWWGAFELKGQPKLRSPHDLFVGTLTPETCGNATWSRQRFERCQVAGQLERGARQVQVACTVRVRHGSWALNWSRIGSNPDSALDWSGQVQIPVEAVESLNEAIEPVASPELTAAMKAHLQVYASLGKATPAPVFVGLLLDRAADERLHRIGFGFSVDFVRAGQVVETLQIAQDPLTCGGRSVFATSRPAVPAGDGADWPKLTGDDLTKAPLEDWTLRIRGDGAAALTDWDFPAYWAGEFTVPLKVVLKQQP